MTGGLKYNSLNRDTNFEGTTKNFDLQYLSFRIGVVKQFKMKKVVFNFTLDIHSLQMFFKIDRELISYKQLLRLLVVLVVIIQINVITYNHFSGYFVLNNFQHFILRMVRGCV